jgi:hypothetical protein
MEYATRVRFGGLSLKTTRWTVSRFGPQNLGGGSEEERGRHVAESQRLRQGEANI